MKPYTKNCLSALVQLCDSSVNVFFFMMSITMKFTYLTCWGVNGHKSFLTATIIKTITGMVLFYHKKSISPSTIPFLNL